MALSAVTTWEVRTTGADTNGGGFVTGASGTDYSQQDAAQYAFADLASTNGTNASPQVTSSSHSFVAADVGDIIQITAGTNWTTGFYQIVSVSGGAATLDKACGSSATLSTGTWAEGGALASPGKAGSGMVAGNDLYIKAGTYTITSASSNVAGGCLTLPAGASASNTTKAFGYNATRGDNPTGASRPLLQAGTISTFTLVSTGANSLVGYIAVDGVSKTSSRGFLCASNSSTFYSKASNCTNFGFIGISASAVCVACEGTGCASNAAFANLSAYYCVADSNTVIGFTIGVTGGICVGCLAVNNSGASADGFSVVDGTLLNCTAYNNGRDGVRTTSGASQNMILNTIAENNAGYGFNSSAASDNSLLLNCAGYNNTSGLVNSTNIVASLQIGLITCSAEIFTNAGSNDFSLNNTTNGGKSCRAAGLNPFPGLSTTGYLDIGAVQHADAGGGGTARRPR